MSSDARQEEVLRALRTVQDPDLHRDLVSLGMIQDLKIDGDRVSFAIVLTTPACPVRDSMKAECDQAVKALPWVRSTTIDMPFATSWSATSCGVVTITTPESGINCDRLNGASPVPGGRSITR